MNHEVWQTNQFRFFFYFNEHVLLNCCACQSNPCLLIGSDFMAHMQSGEGGGVEGACALPYSFAVHSCADHTSAASAEQSVSTFPVRVARVCENVRDGLFTLSALVAYARDHSVAMQWTRPKRPCNHALARNCTTGLSNMECVFLLYTSSNNFTMRKLKSNDFRKPLRIDCVPVGCGPVVSTC